MVIFPFNPTGMKNQSTGQFQATLKGFNKQQHHFD